MQGKKGSHTLAWRILLGLVIGITLGLLANAIWGKNATLEWWITTVIIPIGNIFLRIIFMIVIPMVLSAIILGVAEMGDVRKLGRVGAKSLGITLLLAGTAVAIGLLVVNILQPGKSLSPEKRDQLSAQYREQGEKTVANEQQKMPLSETLLSLIPKNPLQEAVNAFEAKQNGGGMLAVMVFALFVGVAMAVSPPESVKTFKGFCQGTFEISMKIIGFAMRLAPLGVACLSFSVTARLGLDIVSSLAAYAGTVVLGLALHQFGTYSLVVKLLAGRSPLQFFKDCEEAILTAFGTSSSNATLPVSLRVAEEKLKLPPQISRFVLTVGASANQNGTALYEGVTVLFLAQVFGVDLSLGEQIVVALMCVLAGIGTAGVPGGSLPLVVGVLVTIGVPGGAIAIIMGIDRILDMCRTTLNVTGDLVCATVVARGEAGVEAADQVDGEPSAANL